MGKPDSILSTPAKEVERIVAHNLTQSEPERQCYSLQLHPWHLPTDETSLMLQLQEFEQIALRHSLDPQFVAIGECGLDGLCIVPIALQRRAFGTALRLARQLRKPVIIHCVKLWGDMVHDVHAVFPELKSQPKAWQQTPIIIHGYRRGPQLAQQLLDAGFCLSLGKKYNPDVAKMLPKERRYEETDEE